MFTNKRNLQAAEQTRNVSYFDCFPEGGNFLVKIVSKFIFKYIVLK